MCGEIKKRKGCELLIHELKSDPSSFIEVLKYEKLAEIRLDDRGFEEDDYIFLRQTQYDAEDMKRDCQLIYTGRHLMLKILHVQKGYGLKDGYVALSFKVLD